MTCRPRFHLRPLTPLLFALTLPLHAEDKVPAWIWSKPNGTDGEQIYLRKIFKAAGTEKARLSATCDNIMEVYVNGKKIAESAEWTDPQSVDISKVLVKGDNLIAVKAKNQGEGSAGFIASLKLERGGQVAEIVTDTTWKFSPNGGPNWNTSLTFNDRSWKPPVSVALAGGGSWGDTIKANTLETMPETKIPAATLVESMKIKAGFKVELLHSVKASTEGSWVAACFDDKGRLIVSDQYGGLFRVTPPALGGKPEDTKVEPIPVKLGEAQGLCYAFGALYVVTNSDKYPRGLYKVTDTNHDDMFDKVEPLRMFVNEGGEHGPHAVMPGPDGKSLYVIVGDQTPIPNPEECRVPKNWAEDNLLTPPLMGRGFMATTMAPGGWIAKTDPDGKKWEVIATGFRNTYDAAFDKNGSLFTYDADMEWDFSTPWYRPTRICEVVSGGEYGWRSLSKKWPVRWEDSVPPTLDIGPGSPTGMIFGTGAKSFPEKYQNALFACDWSYGKLYAVHMKPEGGSYKAEAEEFITANPLPLTDLAISPKDGALYFTIGGRKVQSGLYRVTYAGPPQPEAMPPLTPLLTLRHQLEAYHEKADPRAVKFAWPYLGHEDRFIRYAARIAVEHNPVSTWKDSALSEKNPRTALTALMALARCADKEKSLLKPIIEALDRIDFTQLKGIDRVTYIRDYELAFSRLGEPDADTKAKVTKKLSSYFPTKEPLLDEDLCETLVFLGDADFLPKAIEIMENAPSQEEQISYAKSLRLAKAGWTPQLRERFFKWVCLRAPTYKGGASFQLFMGDIKKDAIALLSPDEKAALQPILDSKPDVQAPAFTFTPKEFVKDWKIEDMDPLLAAGLEGGRNFENGRNLFGASACFMCHRFGQEGGAIGPDLTSVSGKFSPRDLLIQILEPSKEISDQYGQTEFKMQDGSMIKGRIMNLSGGNLSVNVNMMDPDAVIDVDRKKVVSMEQSKVSMMPPGLLNTCKDTDILDLLAYLLSKGDKTNSLFTK